MKSISMCTVTVVAQMFAIKINERNFQSRNLKSISFIQSKKYFAYSLLDQKNLLCCSLLVSTKKFDLILAFCVPFDKIV